MNRLHQETPKDKGTQPKKGPNNLGLYTDCLSGLHACGGYIGTFQSRKPPKIDCVPGICKICRFLTEILVKTHVLPNSSLSSFFNRYPRSHRLKPHVYICFHISLHISLHMFTSLNIDKMGYHGVSLCTAHPRSSMVPT